MAESRPSRLRAIGMGLAYGVGNLGKFIGPAGLAVIAGSSNFTSPAATADALIPAMELLRRLIYPGADRCAVYRLRNARPHDRRNRQRADRRAAGGGASQGARGLTNGRGSGSPSGATS
jgi:hypothetical protein